MHLKANAVGCPAIPPSSGVGAHYDAIGGRIRVNAAAHSRSCVMLNKSTAAQRISTTKESAVLWLAPPRARLGRQPGEAGADQKQTRWLGCGRSARGIGKVVGDAEA